MATVTTIDVTTLLGSSDFPVNVNDVYSLIETICVQNIRGVKSSNRIEDAFYDYVVENGTVVEEAIIKMADRQNFVKTGAPNLAPKDPTLAVKYFNNWEASQFQTTVRRNDIRKIIADKGTGIDEVVSAILDTLNQGEGYNDYKAMRDIIKNASVGFDANTTLFGDKHAKNIKGLIYQMREAYNALKATNYVGLDDQVSFEQATPVEDIRIAVSESVLNLMDLVELASVFNLTKEELFGKLVVIPFDADYDKFKVLVYDRKALGRGTRLYEYSQDVIGKGLYTNHYLTVERCYFYNGLFKCLAIDAQEAVEAGEASVLEDNTYYTISKTLTHCTGDNSATKVLAKKSYVNKLTADSGYTMTGATVTTLTMGGVDISSTAYEDGVISIPRVTGNIVISISAASV